ncbi:MAG: glycosyltransferase [Erysipelotrichaceae bacterium]|nr:glycosyltransferase [Erysipelotrichaceae bacterium]
MSTIKNICLLNDSFPPMIDGVANAVFNYASIIEKNYGHAIVGTPNYPNVYDPYPFEVIRYDSLDTTKLAGYRFGIPLRLSHLSEYKRKNIDIIHAHCPISSMVLARVLRDELEKPIILHYHTKFDIDIKRAVDAKILQDIAIRSLVENISYADEVWVVSKGAGENLRSLGYQGKYIVMRNGVDFDKGKAPDDIISKLREDYRIPSDRPVYLFVGRMMWYKGIRIILDALKTLKKEGKNFLMIFVGDGMEREQIEEYTKDLGLMEDCLFTGAFRDRTILKGFYSLADLFLFPSTFDTNGIVVSEASASGLSSVLIRGSCAAEEVTEDQNAFLIEEDASSLAKKLLELGDNKELFRKTGERAMEELYLSWEDSVAAAWKRYQVVSDSFVYKKPTLLSDGKITDNLFYAAAELASGLDIVRKRSEMIENKVDSFIDRWL